MFDGRLLAELVAVARKEEIEPAALCAIVEVESVGKLTEADGITPRFLFERHIFYRTLYKRNRPKLARAVNEGLAIPKWDKSTQYRDQGTFNGRMKALSAARAIDNECANRACSWGIGQVLGDNAESLGYASATAMVDDLVNGGVIAQVGSMLRYIRKHRLKPYINMHQWDKFALAYNGPGYAQNRYDVKMATAYRKWSAELDRMAIPTPPTEPDPAPVEIEELPPPYEVPKTIGKSWTVWSVVQQLIALPGAVLAWFMDRPYIMIGVLVFVFGLALFIGRERINKILDKHV